MANSLNTIEIQEILELLPHRYPFLLVDRVTDYVLGESVKAYKNITINEPCFMGHFPEQPIFPGVLILEAMAQAAGVLGFKTMGNNDKLYLYAGIDNARFKRPVVPGDRLEFDVALGAGADDIDVVIHPQSIIHSMVQYVDGSVIAQMGNPDMRTPIAYGLAHPERIEAGVTPLDFSDIGNFSFQTPCFERYPNLKLAIDACKEGQCATTRVNASNEVAVEAFLEGKIQFCDIAKVNDATLNAMPNVSVNSIQQILEQDSLARAKANEIIRGKFQC